MKDSTYSELYDGSGPIRGRPPVHLFLLLLAIAVGICVVLVKGFQGSGKELGDAAELSVEGLGVIGIVYYRIQTRFSRAPWGKHVFDLFGGNGGAFARLRRPLLSNRRKKINRK